MNTTSATQRKHPDIFTAEEAAEYLHLDPEGGERTLETLRDKYGLVGQQIGKRLMYHKKNLDACVARLFGTQAGAAKKN